MAREQQKDYFWKIDRFDGGESDDEKIGLPGAFEYGVGFDTVSQLGKLQVAPKPVLHSDSTVDQVVKWIEPDPDTDDVYNYGVSKIFLESGGVYSVAHTIDSDDPNGQGLRDFNGNLFYRTKTKLGKHDYDSEWDNDYQTGLAEAVDFAPMMRFKNFLLVGNGEFVATLDDIFTWNATRLRIPAGYTVRDFTQAGGLAVIFCVRGTSIAGSDEGLVLFWNGFSQTYENFIPLNGNPHCGVARSNRITMIVGQEPTITESMGVDSAEMLKIPRVSIGDTAEVWPGAIDTWRNKVYFGISAGTSASILRVVREWGAKNAAMQNASNPIFPVSTGTLTGTTLQITAVKKVGTTLRIAWRDGENIGIDEIDPADQQETALYRSLVYDRESPYTKIARRVAIELIGKLKENETVDISLSRDPYVDRDFTDTTTYATRQFTYVSHGGKRILTMPLSASPIPIRSRDLKIEVKVGGSGSTRPIIKRIWVEHEEENEVIPTE